MSPHVNAHSSRMRCNDARIGGAPVYATRMPVSTRPMTIAWITTAQ